MPSGGNTYDKYKERRKITGRLALDNQVHEDAIQLHADGTDKQEVCQMLEGKITVDEIDTLLASPLGARRFQFVQQQKSRDDFEPTSPDECLGYVKQRLVKLSKDAEDKIKIDALKALARVAMDERENKPAAPPPSAGGDLDELKAAFRGTDGKSA